MFLSFLTRMLITTVVAGCGYALAAELPDISGAALTPPSEQFSLLSTASDAPRIAVADAGGAVEPPVNEASPPESEEAKQSAVISVVLQAIRQRQLTPLPSECLSMRFIDNPDDPAHYLIDVRENRHYPACGGDPATAPHLFFFKTGKADGALQTDAGVEPDDFYSLDDAKPPAAALTAEDFSVQVDGVGLTLGQLWNEDVMMSLPPERSPPAQQIAPQAEINYRYYQHHYDALTLVASNADFARRQRSPDDSYLGQITLINPTLATHRGARVGMMVAELERKYGPGEADERGGESWLSWQQQDQVLSARIRHGLVTLITLSNLPPEVRARVAYYR